VRYVAMTIEDIEREVANAKNLFHSKIEQGMFNDALFLYSQSKYTSSASVAFVLYEKMFATKLIRETSYPKGFVPNQKNVEEQIIYLMRKEEEVVDGKKGNEQGLGFTDITMQLFNKKLISQKKWINTTCSIKNIEIQYFTDSHIRSLKNV
jgi:hypothetical protein